jgi:hypothetical protein
MLLDGALLGHHATSAWEPDDLRDLKRERAILGQDAFDQQVTAKVPQDLRASLESGIENAEDS